MPLGTFPDGTRLTAWMERSYFMLQARGNVDSVIEAGEQLAWLGAALLSSPFEYGVASSKPEIDRIVHYNTPNPPSGPAFESDLFVWIDINVSAEYDSGNLGDGRCWQNLFKNPVLVNGYPIRRRPKPDTGLEIPLSMMTRLAQTRFADTFGNKLFIKGFSTMLVPTKQVGNLLIWHLIYNKERNRISYLDNTVPHADNVGVSDVLKARHVLGWCSEVRYYAGKILLVCHCLTSGS